MVGNAKTKITAGKAMDSLIHLFCMSNLSKIIIVRKMRNGIIGSEYIANLELIRESITKDDIIITLKNSSNVLVIFFFNIEAINSPIAKNDQGASEYQMLIA